MRESEIEIGKAVWFAVDVRMADWRIIDVYNKRGFTSNFNHPWYTITDIREHKGEKYLIVSSKGSGAPEWAVKFTELQEKGLLLLDKKKYSIEELKGERIAIRTPASEQFRKIEVIIDNTQTGRWEEYRAKTCMDIERNKVWFGYEAYYKENEWTIIDFDQVEFPGEKPSFHPGDLVHSKEERYPVYDLKKESFRVNFTGGPSVIEEVEYIDGEFMKLKAYPIILVKQSDFQKAEQPKAAQTMNNKPSFTVEGSVPLRKALVEELQGSGLKMSTAIKLYGIDYTSYLTPGAMDNIIGVTDRKEDIHYILPENYKIALQAFKDYFTPEFKVGDIVMVGGRDYNNGNEFIAEVVIAGTKDYWVKNPGNLEGVYSNKNLYKTLCVSTQINRLATKEEIEQYKEQQEEKIVVAGYEMKVIEIQKEYFGHKRAKFCDQQFSVPELVAIDKLLGLQKWVNVDIKIGDTPITVELLDKILKKLS